MTGKVVPTTAASDAMDAEMNVIAGALAASNAVVGNSEVRVVRR